MGPQAHPEGTSGMVGPPAGRFVRRRPFLWCRLTIVPREEDQLPEQQIRHDTHEVEPCISVHGVEGSGWARRFILKGLKAWSGRQPNSSFGWRCYFSRTLHTIATLRVVMDRTAWVAVTGGCPRIAAVLIDSPPGTVHPIAAADEYSALVKDSDKKGETR